MKIQLLGSTVDDSSTNCQFTASYLVNDDVVIDAGSVGFLSSIQAQRRVKHVFLSHSHIDHINSLPIFLDNVYQLGPDCVKVYANQHTIDCLKNDFFNERIWPDLDRLSRDESPFLKWETIENGTVTKIGDLTVTAIDLDHVVPTLGFVIEDKGSAVAIISDTSPTDEIWDVANEQKHLKAIFIESAFPNSMSWLADKSKHLTPDKLSDECKKLKQPVRVIAVHIKPAFYDEVVSELKELELPVEISVTNCDYEF